MATPIPLPSDPLLARRETFPGAWIERWKKGPAAAARLRHLRRTLPTVVRSRSSSVTHRWTGDVGADRTTIETIEITYFARPDVAARLAP